MFHKATGFFSLFRSSTPAAPAAPPAAVEAEALPELTAEEAAAEAQAFLDQHWPNLPADAKKGAEDNIGQDEWQLRHTVDLMAFHYVDQAALEFAVVQRTRPAFLQHEMLPLKVDHDGKRHLVITVKAATERQLAYLRGIQSKARIEDTVAQVTDAWPTLGPDVLRQLENADQEHLTLTSPPLGLKSLSPELLNAFEDAIAAFLTADGRGMQLQAISLNKDGCLQAKVLNPDARNQKRQAERAARLAALVVPQFIYSTDSQHPYACFEGAQNRQMMMMQQAPDARHLNLLRPRNWDSQAAQERRIA
jgi:hypothetical protein